MAKMSLTLFSSGLLITGALAIVSACGSDSKDGDTSTPTPTGTSGAVAFSQVNEVLKAKCGGATCHSSGSPNGTLIDSEVNTTNSKTKIKAKIAPGAASPMPPQGSPALTDAEKSILNNY